MRNLVGEKEERNEILVSWLKKRSLQGERGGKKRRFDAQIHDSFNSKMQYQIKYF